MASAQGFNGVTREAYCRLGRLPRVPVGEDKALIALLTLPNGTRFLAGLIDGGRGSDDCRIARAFPATMREFAIARPPT
jgi:hypothetical protein